MENLYDDSDNDRKYWKWGLFYYNKYDKQLLPKRHPFLMGWYSVNFANPKSILVYFGLILFFILITFISFSISSKN
ncbi:hypothetical protein [Rhizosphaericola mali]|uniref:DUF5808 domain-containing protein n=1 Tax=Rhizosphaericola mali TaxID=2545455 RepID=A0A5P2FYD6_9BACT|nr:hypothetical protein [Rhizosphaericola mali]QES87398.1 hypothetical protein E0W69_001550 [Rhizosphaericola mali]